MWAERIFNRYRPQCALWGVHRRAQIEVGNLGFNFFELYSEFKTVFGITGKLSNFLSKLRILVIFRNFLNFIRIS